MIPGQPTSAMTGWGCTNVRRLGSQTQRIPQRKEEDIAKWPRESEQSATMRRTASVKDSTFNSRLRSCCSGRDGVLETRRKDKDEGKSSVVSRESL